MTHAPIDLTPLQRALDALAGALAYWQAEPEDSSRRPHLRAGADAGLLPDPLSWRRWRDWRNRTSHGYNETEAQAIAEAAQAFLVDAQALLTRLKRAVNDDA